MDIGIRGSNAKYETGMKELTPLYVDSARALATFFFGLYLLIEFHVPEVLPYLL